MAFFWQKEKKERNQLSGELMLTALSRACLEQEMLTLVTPYLRYTSRFIRLDEGTRELIVRATMSRDEALFSLRHHDLSFRFPSAATIYTGVTEVKGLTVIDGKSCLRLKLPETLKQDDLRRAYRARQTAETICTFSTPGFDIYQARLSDISLLGAGLYVLETVPPDTFHQGDVHLLTIPLENDLKIVGKAVLRHLQGRTLGLEFQPLIDGELKQNLSRWIFQKREEDLERSAQRVERAHRIQAESMETTLAPDGLLLVSNDSAEEAFLQKLAEGHCSFQRVTANAGALREGLKSKPGLVLFHAERLDLDERRRLKLLIEVLRKTQRSLPVALIAPPSTDLGQLFAVGNELGAVTSFLASPSRLTYAQRLVQGILRKGKGDLEAPLAPSEEPSST